MAYLPGRIVQWAGRVGSGTGDRRRQALLPQLATATPAEGFALAVKLSRMGVKTT